MYKNVLSVCIGESAVNLDTGTDTGEQCRAEGAQEKVRVCKDRLAVGAEYLGCVKDTVGTDICEVSVP